MPLADEYSVVLATVGLADLEEQAILASDTLMADGATEKASEVRQALFRLLRELEDIARDISKKAQADIVTEEMRSRVRPDTQGGGGRRLEDYVGRSHPIPGVEGSVGINHEPTLDDNVAWWWTNEEGYSGHIGRTFFGNFYDAGFTGRTRPDMSRFREHPLMTVGGKGSGKGTIQNPIPARRFVLHGSDAAKAQWHSAIHAAKSRFLRAVERAFLTAPPPRPRTP